MKNQYFADVGDYGKYAMLRYLVKDGIKISINWYLTEDDDSNDGKYTSYLQKEEMRVYDPELFDALKETIANGNRSVASISEKRILGDVKYYDSILTDSRQQRITWHKAALEVCKDAELVFLDPDNGMTEKKAGKNSSKFCFPEEVVDYYYAGCNVVYYCQKARRTCEQWEIAKGLMHKYLPDCRIFVITFHKGTQRSYIFILHEHDSRRYTALIKDFCRNWSRIFTEETVKLECNNRLLS